MAALGAQGQWRDSNDLPPVDPLYEHFDWQYSAPYYVLVEADDG